MSLPEKLDLGHGHSAAFIWREGADRETGVPVGLLEMHGRCRTYLSWVESDGVTDHRTERPVWTLNALEPLGIEPAVICPSCGIVGLIQNGKYLDVTRVHRPLPAGGEQ